MIHSSFTRILLASGLAALAGTGAHAGPTIIPEPAPTPPPVVESGGGFFDDAGISLAASVGYDSEYLWRGAEYGSDLTWFDVSLGYGFTDELSFSVGAWHGSWRDGDELDVYAGLEYDFGPFALSAGWIYYYFYSGGGDYHEFSLGASTSLWVFDLGLTWYIAPESNLDYHYVEATIETSIPLHEYVSLDLGASVAYGDDDFVGFQGAVPDGGVTHFGASLGLSITVYENATLSPYVAVQVPFDEMEDAYGDELVGGVSLGIEF